MGSQAPTETIEDAPPSGGQTWDESVRAIFADDPDPLGRVQIVCVPAGRWTDRVGVFLANLLQIRFEEDQQRVIRRFLIIGPAGSDAAELHREVVEAVEAALARQGYGPMPEEQRGRLGAFIEAIAAADWSAESARSLIATAPGRSAVVVLEAAAYVERGLPSVFGPGEARIMAPDELWVPNLRALAASAVELAEEQEKFVLLDTGRSAPARDRLEVLGSSGADLLAGHAEGPDATVAARMEAWRALLTAGRIGPVLREIADLEGLDEDGRRVLRAQVMHAASLGDHALVEIKSIEQVDAIAPDLAAKLALIAAEAGGLATARELLAGAVDDLRSSADLQTALRAASRIGDEALVARAEAALAGAHPGSEILHRHRLRAAVLRHDHRTAAALLADRPDCRQEMRFHERLADAFEAAVPDYVGVIGEAGEDRELEQGIRIECARHALSRGLHPHALEILLAPEAKKARAGSFVLLESVEKALIARGPGGVAAVEDDRIAEAVGVLVERLGQDTMNKPLRAGLLDLIEPKTSGRIGHAIVILLLLHGAGRPVTLVPRPTVTGSVRLDDLLADDDFRERLRAWQEAEMPVRIGKSIFPREDLSGDPDEICDAVLAVLEASTEQCDEEAAQGLLGLLGFGCAVAPHARVPNLDITMVRTRAVALARSGSGQAARDLAETLMEIGDTPRRKRLAWMGIADVYARCGCNLEASLYMAAGYAADDEADLEQLWHETLLLNRILRDQLLLDDALHALAAAAAVLKRVGRLDDYAHRLETIEIQTRMKIVGRQGDPEGDLQALLERTVANARDVLRAKDDPLPAASVLSQLLRIAGEWRISPHLEAADVLEELLTHLGPSQIERIRSFGRDVPTAEDLLRLLRTSAGQRYSDEVGTDAEAVSLAARRALDANSTLADAELTSLALEMTFDRAIATPGWGDANRPPEPPQALSTAADTAREISAQGTNVILAGFARDGSLVRITAEGGGLQSPVREDRSLFDRNRLVEWRETYPFQYGFEHPSSNVFRTSTAQLRFANLPPGRTLLIGDTLLRSFPPNLLQEDEDFAGVTRPMAAAPSLSWLAAARRRKVLGDGRRLAWISAATSHGTTLAMIRDRCAEDLDRHAFGLDENPRLPEGFDGASIAIVVAHGGLAPGNDAFQVISDEGKLYSTADDLARALHNVGLVILFVCSGGRSDKHPASDATLGLAREVLDQGAQAVIGSPWPLDSSVPPRWLPTFLARWDAGDRVIDAAYQANRAVLAHWPHDLPRGIALTVFGNPDLKCDRAHSRGGGEFPA